MLETLKTVGSLFGIIAFFWKAWDLFNSYLHIDLVVDIDGSGAITAKTTVDNKGGKSKRIDNALLLIGPEAESPIDTYNQLYKSRRDKKIIKYTNEIAETRLKEQYAKNGMAIIPLPFYYSENVSVGDEKLSYRSSIDFDGIEAGNFYAVRFFIYSKRRLHRSTHDSFKKPTR